MATDLQEVYDSFFAKVPDEDFTYKADLIYQYFKAANGYSYKTVPEDLTYIINSDNIVLYISSLATSSGNVILTLNSVNYTIPILATGTLFDIANQIVAVIPSAYTVETDYTNTFPIIIITLSGSNLSAEYKDIDNTGVVINITKTYNGNYVETLKVDSIELIALFMASQYYNAKLTSLSSIKQHIGTQNFSKLPNFKDQYDSTKSTLNDIDEKIYKFRQEFYTYSN